MHDYFLKHIVSFGFRVWFLEFCSLIFFNYSFFNYTEEILAMGKDLSLRYVKYDTPKCTGHQSSVQRSCEHIANNLKHIICLQCYFKGKTLYNEVFSKTEPLYIWWLTPSHSRSQNSSFRNNCQDYLAIFHRTHTMKEAKKNFMHTILHVSFKLLSLGNLGSRRKNL